MAVKRSNNSNKRNQEGAKAPVRRQQSQRSEAYTERPERGVFAWLLDLPDYNLGGLTRRAAVFVTVASILLLIMDVFLIASLFTNWTGVLGSAARGWIASKSGGGGVIVLLYVGYICLSVILRRRIPQPFLQTIGTASLYLCSSLLLGLLDLTTPGSSLYAVTSPGLIGNTVATWSFENIGPLGTTLAGAAAVALTLACYGFTTPFIAAYNAVRKFFVQLTSRPRRPRTKSAAAENGENAEDDVSPEDEGDDYEDETSDDCDEIDEDEAPDGDDESPELPLPTEVVAVDEIEYDAGGISVPMGHFPPPPELYGAEKDDSDGISPESARPWGERIIDSLAQFGIEAELADILLGPTVIQFRIQPLPGIKVNRIVALSNDLAMALAVSSLRIEAPIPGHPYVGIEIPNPKRTGITLRSIIEEDVFQDTEYSLPLPMGVTINGDPLVVGLEEMPHLLVAGTTGSGKSVFVNSCIVGLCSIRKPDELKMVLVDPKRVEMAVYEKLPHLLTPPVTDAKKAVHVLGWAIREMERRYTNCASVKVRNLASYNGMVLPKDRLPHIVIVVDELADLMMTAAKEVEEYICRLAQMARAVGIHLMLATQRPSVNVITGLIKANVPARVAFTLPSMMDSRTILDTGGAEKLLGKGDMLFLSTRNPKPIRVQSPWIDERSIACWIDYLVNMFGEPIYTDIEDQGDAPSGFEEA
ncbi:MAG: DNA translocase FtsK, partial [Synergistaceae bacterium]|nr:DNA translocase FtsK [Synergistaceae bacterium]